MEIPDEERIKRLEAALDRTTDKIIRLLHALAATDAEMRRAQWDSSHPARLAIRKVLEDATKGS